MSKGNRRHNGRPALRLSTLRPDQYTLAVQAGEKTSVVCPDCGCWRLVERRMIKPHRSLERMKRDERIPKCEGSGQLIEIDVDPAGWLAWLRQHVRRMESGCDARVRKGTTLVKKAAPKAPAVARMQPVPVTSPAQGELRQASTELARHRARCARCQPRQHGQTSDPCVQGALLHVRVITAQRAYTFAHTSA